MNVSHHIVFNKKYLLLMNEWKLIPIIRVNFITSLEVVHSKERVKYITNSTQSPVTGKPLVHPVKHPFFFVADFIPVTNSFIAATIGGILTPGGSDSSDNCFTWGNSVSGQFCFLVISGESSNWNWVKSKFIWSHPFLLGYKLYGTKFCHRKALAA
jgi:hypothetical protein